MLGIIDASLAVFLLTPGESGEMGVWYSCSLNRVTRGKGTEGKRPNLNLIRLQRLSLIVTSECPRNWWTSAERERLGRCVMCVCVVTE